MKPFTNISRPSIWHQIAAVVCASSALAACGATESRGSGGSTLDIQFFSPPLTGLDPAKSGGGLSLIYNSLAYDSLVYQTPQGTLEPDLATGWKWADASSTTLDLTLRQGVKFSDGTDMTAEGVAQ